MNYKSQISNLNIMIVSLSQMRNLFVLLSALLMTSCSDALFGCGQKVTEIQTSPDNTKAMYWVSRHCGATTAPLLTVSIIPSSQFNKIDHEGRKISKKNLFMSHERGIVRANWLSENSIEVLYDHREKYGRKGHFFKQKNELGDVSITYRETELEY